MKTTISTIHIVVLSFILCTSVDAKCGMMSIDDNERVVYSCVQATFNDVNDIPVEAEWIRFTISKLSHIPKRGFAKFPLHGLSFYNCKLGHINSNAFDGLEKLQQLTFYGSDIHVLKGSWFKDMSSLTHLFLDQNDMVYIEPDVFTSIPNLEYLNIENNNFNCLTKRSFMYLKKLKHVRIDKNPWLCTCYVELIGWINNRQIEYRVQNMSEARMECMQYISHSSDFKIELNMSKKNFLASKTNYLSISPAENVLCVGTNISILSRIPENVKSIKFLNSQLPKVPRFAFFRFGNNLSSLDLSNCSVSEIHPEAFAGLSKLEQLILFNNSITMVRAEWFRDLYGLKRLAMNNNAIEHIQSSVYPLLDKLETLSLKNNEIGCFPRHAFTSMTHLKYMTIANNTWICNCLEDFRKWLNESGADYQVLPGQCTDNKTQMISKKYISGYRNVTFPQDFESEETKIINDKARIVSGGSLQSLEPYHDTIKIFTDENYGVTVTRDEAYHMRNKEFANQEQKIRQYYIHYNQNTQTKNNVFEGSSIEQSFSNMKKSYVSVGGTIWDIIMIPVVAEAIRFERSAIPKIVSEIFVHHFSLRVLEFISCGIREIETHAFKELINLQELILDDNEIRVVKSAWFKGTRNLEKLSLSKNYIFRIEHGVFQLLPNLNYFGISNNELNCIGIKGLSQLKELHSMDVGNNPWSCLCQEKLKQWLIERKIQYDRDIFDKQVNWFCIEEYQGSEVIKKDKYHHRNSFENRSFGDDMEVEESAIIQLTANTQNTNIIQKSIDPTDDAKITQAEENYSDFDLRVTQMQQADLTTTTAEPEYPRGRCMSYLVNQLGESRWLCNGCDILALDEVPSSAKRIEFIDSNISIIPDNAFVRFPNLTNLHFYNSSIRDIDHLAFATLHKLKSLIFVENYIPIVRSSWFYNLLNISVLGLVRNSIKEIESDVFGYLPNLKLLSIQENNLRCIYTNSLSSLRYLKRVTMQDNPWKWRCREELTQFLEARNVSYIKSETYEGKYVLANLLMNENMEST